MVLFALKVYNSLHRDSAEERPHNSVHHSPLRLSIRVYSSECRKIISCRKFWHGAKTLAQNFGKEKLAKTFGMDFMPKFRAEILSQNTSTVPKLLAQNFGREKTCRNFRLKKHAKISCRKNRLEMAFRRTDV